MKKKQRNTALGAAVIAALSYVAGVLTAPKSGKATRRDIQKTAVKAKKEAEKNLKLLHTELSELIDHGRQSIDRAKTATQKEFGEAIENAQTVKNKARSVLSSLHEGDDEDKDLEQAIQEANKAITHLKQYVKKSTSKRAG